MTLLEKAIPPTKATKAEKPKPKGRICPECETFAPLLSEHCPDCGFVFPPPAPRTIEHNYRPDTTSNAVFKGFIKRHEVTQTTFAHHLSKNGNAGIKVTFYIKDDKPVSKYLSPFSEYELARNQVSRYFKDGGHVLMSPVNTYPLDDLIWHLMKCKPVTGIIVDYHGKFPDVTKIIYGEHRKINPNSLGAMGEEELPISQYLF